MFEEEVVGLNEELAGVFLGLSHPPLPQQDRRAGALVGVKLLRAAPQMEKKMTLNKTYARIYSILKKKKK